MAVLILPKDRQVWVHPSGVVYELPEVRYEKTKDGYKMTLTCFKPLQEHER